MYLGGRRRWVPLCSFMERGSKRAWILFSPSRRYKKQQEQHSRSNVLEEKNRLKVNFLEYCGLITGQLKHLGR